MVEYEQWVCASILLSLVVISPGFVARVTALGRRDQVDTVKIRATFQCAAEIWDFSRLARCTQLREVTSRISATGMSLPIQSADWPETHNILCLCCLVNSWPIQLYFKTRVRFFFFKRQKRKQLKIHITFY